MSRLAGYTALVAATILGLVLVWQFRAVIFLFFISLIVAAAVRPAIDHLVKRRVPLLLALILTYVFGLTMLALILQLVIATLMVEIPRLANDFTVAYEVLHPRWLEGSPFQQALAAQLPAPEQVYAAITGERGEMLVRHLFDFSRGFILVIASFISVLLLSVYWSADQVHFERLWLSLLPAGQRPPARHISRTIEASLGAYLRSEVAQSFLAGVLLAVGYSWIGLEYPVTLALLGALAWLVPVVGLLLAIVPVLLVGLLTNPVVVLAGAAYAILVLALLEFLVEPRLFDGRRHSPILTVLLMIPLADAYGIAGLIIAPLLAASLQITFSTLAAHYREVVAPKPETARIGDLQDRLAAIQTMFASPYYPRSPEVTNLMKRLALLVEKASQTLPAEPGNGNNGNPAVEPAVPSDDARGHGSRVATTDADSA
jgi:putative permease